MVVPDQRKLPAMAGTMRTNGAVTGDGMRPSLTIGSENTIRISLAWASVASAPSGPVRTTVRVPGAAGDCAAADAASRTIEHRASDTDRTRVIRSIKYDLGSRHARQQPTLQAIALGYRGRRASAASRRASLPAERSSRKTRRPASDASTVSKASCTPATDRPMSS